MKFWYFLGIFLFRKILSLKSFDNSITLLILNSGRIIVAIVIIIHFSELAQMNKAYGFLTILKI